MGIGGEFAERKVIVVIATEMGMVVTTGMVVRRAGWAVSGGLQMYEADGNAMGNAGPRLFNLMGNSEGGIDGDAGHQHHQKQGNGFSEMCFQTSLTPCREFLIR